MSMSRIFKHKSALVTVLYIFGVITVSVGQDVALKNASFEGVIKKGVQYLDLDDWYDCGPLKFLGQTPPDIHPDQFWSNDATGQGIDKPPSEGMSYLGMVVRKNGTYESVGQQLDDWLKAEQCYLFSVDLMRSLNYWSNVNGQPIGAPKRNFSDPIVLRIWGSNSLCYNNPNYGAPELLAESAPIRTTNWETSIFRIQPNKDYKFITLEAFYVTPVEDTYLGHLLLDNASNFIAIDCEDEEVVLEFFEEREQLNKINKKIIEDKKAEILAQANKKKSNTPIDSKKKKPTTQKKTDNNIDDTPLASTVDIPIKKEDKPVVKKEEPKQASKTSKITKEPKILKNLSTKSISVGQKLKLDKLYFEQDTTALKNESYIVLQELADFLNENNSVRIEIGGHTNGIPDHDYCDVLSEKRAKTVADYLISQGVDRNVLEYKGYGKRKPVASNKSVAGRALNQRVEITILQI